MDNEEIAVIVRYWRDVQTNMSQLRVVHVETGEEVHLSDGNFLLRISLGKNGTVIRCLVRHLASGREAYLQGGANLRTFVNACLLNDGETTSSSEEMFPPSENPPEASSKSNGDTSAPATEASPLETSTEDTNE